MKGEELKKRGSNIAETLHLVAEKLHRRSMVVIFTDAFVHPEQREPLFDALRHLRHNKHEVLLFHTYEQDKEIDLDFGNKPYYFIDMESDRRIKVFPHEIADRYREEMSRDVAEVKRRAMQYRIDYVAVDIGKGFQQVMEPYILKRGRHY